MRSSYNSLRNEFENLSHICLTNLSHKSCEWNCVEQKMKARIFCEMKMWNMLMRQKTVSSIILSNFTWVSQFFVDQYDQCEDWLSLKEWLSSYQDHMIDYVTSDLFLQCFTTQSHSVKFLNNNSRDEINIAQQAWESYRLSASEIWDWADQNLCHWCRLKRVNCKYS